jgi:hypothetical protein
VEFIDGLDGHVTDAIREDEVDALIPNLFVLSHGTEESDRRMRGQSIRKPGLAHKVTDASSDVRISQAELYGQSRGSDHADGNGLPVFVAAVLRDRFQGMAHRMPEIQDAPPVALPFIFGHDHRLDG